MSGLCEDCNREEEVVPRRIQGDGPCSDCGTADNIIWSTSSILWNAVIRPQGEVEADPFLCIPCFVVRVDKAGFAPTGWTLTPEFHWETTQERQRRRGGLLEH